MDRRVEINKEEIPGSRRSMHGYIWTCSRRKMEENLELWVLNRGVFHFCVRRTPLQGTRGNIFLTGDTPKKQKKKTNNKKRRNCKHAPGEVSKGAPVFASQSPSVFPFLPPRPV